MIKIEDYSERYDDAIRAIDHVTFYAIRYHNDVIRESACVAVDGDKLLGVGLLKAGATFLKVDELELPYYFVHAEYHADDKADPESQVVASDMLLEELKSRFDKLQDRYPDRRLILRLWCDAAKTAYLEFLMSHGFRPMRVTPILVRHLTDGDEGEMNDRIHMVSGEVLTIREMDPNNDDFMRAYTVTNREAFEVEDSEAELKFTMGGKDAHVLAAMNGRRVIAAVTLWGISDERAATENIFCAADHRHKGVTSALLRYAFGFLSKKGYKVASLTVFGDNQPAAQLYFKLGYEVEGNFLECHYERSYKNVGF